MDKNPKAKRMFLRADRNFWVWVSLCIILTAVFCFLEMTPIRMTVGVASLVVVFVLILRMLERSDIERREYHYPITVHYKEQDVKELINKRAVKLSDDEYRIETCSPPVLVFVNEDPGDPDSTTVVFSSTAKDSDRFESSIRDLLTKIGFSEYDEGCHI